MTQFEALLPQDDWRGDYLQQGCGGLCGKADVSLDDPSRTSGYQAPYAPLANGEMVVAADDQGHETPSNADALWARDDLRLRAVFGYSSEHQLATNDEGGHSRLLWPEARLRLLQRRLRRRARSAGPGAALPGGLRRDHCGRPANNWAPLAGLMGPWVAAANMNAEGKQILTAEKLPALHAAVMAACADKTA